MAEVIYVLWIIQYFYSGSLYFVDFSDVVSGNLLNHHYCMLCIFLISDVIEKLREVPAGPMFRPLLSVEFRKQNPDLFTLIDELWNDDPLHRPSASRAYKALHRINPSK